MSEAAVPSVTAASDNRDISKSQSQLTLDADNPLVRSYNRYRTGIVTSALLLQAYLSPIADKALSPQILSGPESAPSEYLGGLELLLSALAFIITAGLIYTFWVRG